MKSSRSILDDDNEEGEDSSTNWEVDIETPADAKLAR